MKISIKYFTIDILRKTIHPKCKFTQYGKKALKRVLRNFKIEVLSPYR